MTKWIWFITNKIGLSCPIYYRKAYKKARFKRKSERMAPGFWSTCVANKERIKYEIVKNY